MVFQTLSNPFLFLTANASNSISANEVVSSGKMVFTDTDKHGRWVLYMPAAGAVLHVGTRLLLQRVHLFLHGHVYHHGSGRRIERVVVLVDVHAGDREIRTRPRGRPRADILAVPKGRSVPRSSLETLLSACGSPTTTNGVPPIDDGPTRHGRPNTDRDRKLLRGAKVCTRNSGGCVVR